jgi:glycosyltransferase involved in cell wall biosynthesis
VYRVAAYLANCLDSILDNAVDVEVVVVDDGSPDRSGEIADGYARRDRRVRVLHLDANVGLGLARNAGLERATGEYVWFVDSDDWLPERAVRGVLERLTSTRPDVLVVDHAEVFEDGRVVATAARGVLGGVSGPVTVAECPRLLRLAQSACTKVVRRAFLDEIDLRFFPGWYEDSSFSHPLLMAAKHIEVLDQVCYYYRQREAGGITKTLGRRHFDAFEQYRRLFEMVDAAAPAWDEFRGELFRLMIDHYLVIVGNRRRLPPESREEFFRRMAADYRSYLPEGGYDVPAGIAGFKHRLVRHDAYRAYAAFRLAHKIAVRPLRLGGALARRRVVTPLPLRAPPPRVPPDPEVPRSAGAADQQER